jgi:Uma2 family endonuclease
MSTILPTELPLAPQDLPEIPTDLPVEDGIPLESDWHRLDMTLLIEQVTQHFKGRDDYFVGGNMFIHFSTRRLRNKDYLGPDFFFVANSSLNPSRPYWAVWDEDGRYPDVIIELTSPTTAKNDFGEKKEVYERIFRTREYYIYDPETRGLRGWRLDNHSRYQEIAASEKGWLWCEQLGLWLGTWNGKYQQKENCYLRFFDDAGNPVPSEGEAEKQRADAEKQRADAEKQRADSEKQRADALQAELARLRAQGNG